MRKPDITWKLFGAYLLTLILMMWANTAKAQMQLVVFNAGWNDGNDVRDWAFGMEDIQTYMYVDIGKDAELQKKHKIAVIPTIIYLKTMKRLLDFKQILVLKWWQQKKRYKKK